MPSVGSIPFRVLALLALTASGAAGCGSDSTGPATVTGEYELVQVRTSDPNLSGGGDALPVTFTFAAQGQTVTFTSGDLILDDDGTYYWIYGYTQDVDLVNGNEGTYVRNGNSIAFTRHAGPETDDIVGTINGTTITLAIAFGDFPFQLDYRRR